MLCIYRVRGNGNEDVSAADRFDGVADGSRPGLEEDQALIANAVGGKLIS